MTCPVCNQENRSALCPRCGFDSSRDYGKYPTFGPVENTTSASAKRQEQQKTVESIPAEPEPQPVVEQAKPVLPVAEPEKTVSLVAEPEKPVPPFAEPVKPAQRFPIWLAAAVCTFVVALGIAIGVGGGKADPAEPGESVQMQEPVVTTTAPPETTADPERWRNNILRIDSYLAIGTSSVFLSGYLRKQISSITVLDTLVDMPVDAWDVSEAGDGRVMAWVKPTGELYDLYIGAEGGINAGKSCNCLFAGYVNTVQIAFGDAIHRLLQQQTYQGKIEGLATCITQTASPLGCLNNLSQKYLSNFLGSLHH